MDDKEKLRLFAQLAEDSALLQDLLSNSQYGIVGTDESLSRIVLFSKGSEIIFSRKAEDVIGTNVKDLYQVPDERDALIKELMQKGPGEWIKYETKFMRGKEGSIDADIIDVKFNLTIRYKDKEPIGTLGIIEDVTEKKNLLKGMTEILYPTLYDYDKSLGDHTQKVSWFSEIIGRRLGMPIEQISDLGIAVLFHDYGKRELKKEILLNGKTYLMEDEEKIILMRHCEEGEKKLKEHGMPKKFQLVARYHHERWDGKGYFGLKEKEIPFWARLVAIADAYDSMTEERSYRLKMDKETAIEELKRCSRRDFDREKIFSYNKTALKDIIDKEAKGVDDKDVSNIILMITREAKSVFDGEDEKDVYEKLNSVFSAHRKALNSSKHGKVLEFMTRIENHSEAYLVHRMHEELQFDPDIAGVFIEFLEKTKGDPLR